MYNILFLWPLIQAYKEHIPPRRGLLLQIICFPSASWFDNKYSDSIVYGWVAHPCNEEIKDASCFPKPKIREHPIVHQTQAPPVVLKY